MGWGRGKEVWVEAASFPWVPGSLVRPRAGGSSALLWQTLSCFLCPLTKAGERH